MKQGWELWPTPLVSHSLDIELKITQSTINPQPSGSDTADASEDGSSAHTQTHIHPLSNTNPQILSPSHPLNLSLALSHTHSLSHTPFHSLTL